MDPIAHKRDDIFGNSATKELYNNRTPQQDITIKKNELILSNGKSLEEMKDPKPIRLLKASAQ